MRTGKSTETTAIFDKTFSWKVTSHSLYNEDTGDQRIMLTHELTGLVLYTDEVNFQIAFQADGDANIGPLIDKDVVRCRLTNNTM